MMDDVWFEIIIPDHPLPPALAPRPAPQGKNEQDGEQVRLLERAPTHYLAITGEFFGRGFLFPTFNAGIPDMERFPQTFPVTAHASHRLLALRLNYQESYGLYWQWWNMWKRIHPE